MVWERSLLDVLEPSTLLPGKSSKIGRALSTRGITLCRWKFPMTAAAVSPFLSERQRVGKVLEPGLLRWG